MCYFVFKWHYGALKRIRAIDACGSAAFLWCGQTQLNTLKANKLRQRWIKPNPLITPTQLSGSFGKFWLIRTALFPRRGTALTAAQNQNQSLSSVWSSAVPFIENTSSTALQAQAYSEAFNPRPNAPPGGCDTSTSAPPPPTHILNSGKYLPSALFSMGHLVFTQMLPVPKPSKDTRMFEDDANLEHQHQTAPWENWNVIANNRHTEQMQNTQSRVVPRSLSWVQIRWQKTMYSVISVWKCVSSTNQN